ASPDAVAIAKRLDRNDFFPRGDLAADHPIQRTAGEDFFIALRRHPRDVDMVTRQAFLLRRLHAFGDPALELLHGVAADGKFDQMERHESRLAFGGGVWRISRRSQPGPRGLAHREPVQAEPGPPSPSAPTASWARSMPATD